jgi:hypothetical protein
LAVVTHTHIHIVVEPADASATPGTWGGVRTLTVEELEGRQLSTSFDYRCKFLTCDQPVRLVDQDNSSVRPSR